MKNRDKTKYKCCNCPFVSTFLLNFFDFGYNCGSIITEIISLFRTFQKLSAPATFSAKLSPESLEMFEWAKKIIEKFANLVRTNPLTDFELYEIYTLIIPITILIFFSSIISNKFILYCIVYGLFIMLGSGFGFIGVESGMAILLIIFSSAILLIGILSFRFCCGKCEGCCPCFSIFSNFYDHDLNEDDHDLFSIFLASGPTITILYILLIPIMIERERLIKVFSIIAAILFGISFLLLVIFIFFIQYDNINATNKFLTFLTNCLSLLIIPSTEKFINIMKGRYKNDWRCVLSYLFISLLLPITVNFILIYTKHHSIISKYKNSNEFFYYIEVIDIFKQILYAIFAGFDIIWGCIIIDIGWLVFIIIFRPYYNYSEYYLTGGICLVTSISNITLLCAKYGEFGILNFGVTVFLLVLAISPAIIAMYVYFIKDFIRNEKDTEKNNNVSSQNKENNSEFENTETNDNVSSQSEENNSKTKSNLDSMEYLVYFIKIITPIAWFLYSLNISLIDDKVKIPNE